MNEDVTMEWLMEDEIDPRAGLSLARMIVPVGVISELHHHPNCSETIHLLEGVVEQRVDNKWRRLSAGETCLIPLGAKHQTRNVGDMNAVMIIAYSAGSRIYVAEGSQ